MNPYANVYLMVDRQHQRDLARLYKGAQRRALREDFPDRSEYRPVRKSRIAVAMDRLRRRQSPVSGTSMRAADARARRAPAA